MLPDLARFHLCATSAATITHIDMPDLYRVSAKYYNEAYATLEDLRDLQFYLEMAGHTDGCCWSLLRHRPRAATHPTAGARNRGRGQLASHARPASAELERHRSTFVSWRLSA